ncbi:hypothetical protein F442_12423 [Phytophthora nicotianae P10297]|uniref:Uncharacterized protein n=1 Tax=Phytophthora nicotianae P10297 TaxID=1317064 RepID=W2YYY6_PHYNI|nr:hypothetical protein F442_12423 [Phytophthora nicotianae P10297]
MDQDGFMPLLQTAWRNARLRRGGHVDFGLDLFVKYYDESKKHSKQPMYPSVPLLSVMQLQHKPDYTTEMTCGYRTILCFSSCSTSTDSSKKLLQQPGNQMNVRRFKLS